MKSIVDESLMSKDFHLTEMTVKDNLKALIYDNCLPLDIFSEMSDILLGTGFIWIYNEEVVEKRCQVKSPIDGYDNDDIYQFCHPFYMPAARGWAVSVEIIDPILESPLADIVATCFI